MNAYIICGRSFDGVPAQIQISRAGIERIAVGGKLQIGVFGIGLRDRVVCNGIVGVEPVFVRRGKAQAAAALLSADQHAVFLHLPEAVEPVGGRSGDVPGVPARGRDVLARHASG